MFTYNPVDRHNTVWPWAFRDDAFSSEEIEKINEQVKDIPKEKAKIEDEKDVTKGRNSTIQWIDQLNKETRWILDRVSYEIMNLNNQFYNYDLYGFDSIQYTTYVKKDYYDWHMDTLLGPEINQQPPRKLSATVLLNDDFEGGDFEFFTGLDNKPLVPKLKKGSIVVFPSFMYHRVAPVTKGVRNSLVAWVLGPKFK